MSRSQNGHPLVQSQGDVPLEGSTSAYDNSSSNQSTSTLGKHVILQSVDYGSELNVPDAEAAGLASSGVSQARSSSLALRREARVDGSEACTDWEEANCLESYCCTVHSSSDLGNPVTATEIFSEETVMEPCVKGNTVPIALEALFLSTEEPVGAGSTNPGGKIQLAENSKPFDGSWQGNRVPLPLINVHSNQNQVQQDGENKSEANTKSNATEAMHALGSADWPSTHQDIQSSQRPHHQQIEWREFRLFSDHSTPDATTLGMEDSSESPPDAVARPVKIISKPSIGIHLKGISSTPKDLPNGDTVSGITTISGVLDGKSMLLREEASLTEEEPRSLPMATPASRSSLNTLNPSQCVNNNDAGSNQRHRRKCRLETRRALLDSMRFVSPLRARGSFGPRANSSLIDKGAHASGVTRKLFSTASETRELTVSQVISAWLQRKNGSNITGEDRQLGLPGIATSSLPGASASRGSWQSSLVYSSKTYSSLDQESLVFYLRMATLFESHWTSILPMSPANSHSILASSLAYQQQRPLPPSIGLYLITPFLVRALRKFRTSQQNLADIIASEISRHREGGVCDFNYKEATPRAVIDWLLTVAQRGAKLPNPLRLRLGDSGGVERHRNSATTFPLGMPPGRDVSSGSGSSCNQFNKCKSSERFVQGRVIDLFVCCGGKDMLALDWIPFISRFLHYSLSAKAKVLQTEALSRGFKTFDEPAVVSAAAGLAKEVQISNEGDAPQLQHTFERERLDTALAVEKAFEKGMNFVLAATESYPTLACGEGGSVMVASHERRSEEDVAYEADPPTKGSDDYACGIREFKVQEGAFSESCPETQLHNTTKCGLFMTKMQFMNDSEQGCWAKLRTRSAGGPDELEEECLKTRGVVQENKGKQNSSGIPAAKMPSAPTGTGSSASIELRPPIIVKVDSAFALIDYPGYGHSVDCAPTPQGCVRAAVEGTAEAVRHLRRLFGKSCCVRINILGYSLGGAVSLHAAAVLASELLKMRERLRRKWRQGPKQTSADSTPCERRSTENSPVDTWQPMMEHRSCSSSSKGSDSEKCSSNSYTSEGTSGRELETRHPASTVGNIFSEACKAAVAANENRGESSLKDLDSPLRDLTSLKYFKPKHRLVSQSSDSSYTSNESSDASSNTASLWGEDSDGSGTLRTVLKEIEDDYDAQLAQCSVRDTACRDNGEEFVSFNRLLLLAAFTDTADCAAAYLQLPGAVNAVLKNIIQYMQDNSTKWDNEVAMRRLCDLLALGGSYFSGFRLSIFHGTEDKVVPCWMGARLFATAISNQALHSPDSVDETQAGVDYCYDYSKSNAPRKHFGEAGVGRDMMSRLKSRSGCTPTTGHRGVYPTSSTCKGDTLPSRVDQRGEIANQSMSASGSRTAGPHTVEETSVPVTKDEAAISHCRFGTSRRSSLGESRTKPKNESLRGDVGMVRDRECGSLRRSGTFRKPKKLHINSQGGHSPYVSSNLTCSTVGVLGSDCDDGVLTPQPSLQGSGASGMCEECLYSPHVESSQEGTTARSARQPAFKKRYFNECLTATLYTFAINQITAHDTEKVVIYARVRLLSETEVLRVCSAFFEIYDVVDSCSFIAAIVIHPGVVITVHFNPLGFESLRPFN